MATGRWTTAALHLLATALAASVPPQIDDFDSSSQRTPWIADLRRGGRQNAVDLSRAGGSTWWSGGCWSASS